MLVFLLFLEVDSLSLDHAITLALSQSPAYYESKITLDKSRILFYQTFSNLLPTISATARYTRSEYPEGVSLTDYSSSITLNQPIFDLDILSSVFISSRQVKGNQIQHKAEISNLILRLKTTYYNLINARELLSASEIAIKRAEENLKLIEAKYTIGAASRLELLQGEVFRLRTLQDRAQAKTLEITAHEELKSILGIHNDIYLTDTLIPPGTIEFPSLDSLALILGKVSYNIQLAQELRNVAKLDLIASYLAFLPKVSFFYGYTYSADSFIFDFQQYRDNAMKNYGISVSFPIFEIKSLVFNYLSAKKEVQLREFSKKQALLETEKSLRATYYALVEAYESLQFAKKSLEAATEASAIAKEQYALGAISFLDFLTTEKDLDDSRVTYTSSLSNVYIQRAQLSYLLGELAFNKEWR